MHKDDLHRSSYTVQLRSKVTFERIRNVFKMRPRHVRDSFETRARHVRDACRARQRLMQYHTTRPHAEFN